MISEAKPLPIAKTAAEEIIAILPGMANRHGLIAGATGTGKTVTLRVLAEQFSSRGVPVFLADVKGDLAGLCRPGGDNHRRFIKQPVGKFQRCHARRHGYPQIKSTARRTEIDADSPEGMVQASRFEIYSTPTVLVLSENGEIAARLCNVPELTKFFATQENMHS